MTSDDTGRPPPQVPAEPQDDIFAISEPETPLERPMPVWAERHSVFDQEEEAEDDPIPSLPMIQGVFTFPFYPWTLLVWVILAIGWTICALGFLTALFYATVIFQVGVSVGFTVFLLFLLIAAYTSACFILVIEETVQGTNSVKDWPIGLWRDWVWTLPTTGGLFGITVAACAMLRWATGTESWLPFLPLIFVSYPILLASALNNGSPLELFSKNVLRSLLSVWWAWILVIAVSTAMAVGWAVLFLQLFPRQPWATAGVMTPLIPGMILLYARLMGRLLMCAQMHDAWKDD